MGTGDAPAQEPEAKGVLVGARRGRLPGGDAPNLLRSLIPISFSGVLLQPLCPPEAAQRGGRAGGRTKPANAALHSRSDGAFAGHLLQPPSPGSQAGNPRGLRLCATPRLGLSTADLLGQAPQSQPTETPRPSRRRLGKRWSKRRRPRGSAYPPATEGPRSCLWGKVKSTGVCLEDAPRPLNQSDPDRALGWRQRPHPPAQQKRTLRPVTWTFSVRTPRRAEPSAKKRSETRNQGGRGLLAPQERSRPRPAEPRGPG